MRKKIVVKKEEVVEVWECDICGKAAQEYCRLCGRDICVEHEVYDTRGIGDSMDFFCRSCWDNGIVPFRAEKENLENEFDKKCDQLYNKWKEVALKAIEKKLK